MPSATPPPASAAWQELPVLRQARKDHSLTSLPDGSVIAVGGRDQQGALLASIERLAPGAKGWQTIGQLGAGRADHSATLVDERIVIVGGTREAQDAYAGEPTTNGEVFDPKSGRITAGPSLRAPRLHHQAFLNEAGALWIVGGGGMPDPAHTEVLHNGAPQFELGPQHSGVNLSAAWPTSDGVVLLEGNRGTTRAPIKKFSRFVNAGRTQDPPVIEWLTPSSATLVTHGLPETRSMMATVSSRGVLVLAEVGDAWRAWMFNPSTKEFASMPAPPGDSVGSTLLSGPGGQALGISELGAVRFDGKQCHSMAAPPVDLYGYAVAATTEQLMFVGGSKRARDDRGVTGRSLQLRVQLP